MRITYPDSDNLSGCAHTLRIPHAQCGGRARASAPSPAQRPSRGLAAVPVGGGRARASAPSPAQLEAAAGPAGPGRGAGGRRQGLGKRTKPRSIGGRRGACRAWPRCRRAAAGPGRASRSTTPSEARVWRSRGRAAAHRHTQRPGPFRQATRRPEIRRAAAHGRTEQPQPQQAAPTAAAAQ